MSEVEDERSVEAKWNTLLFWGRWVRTGRHSITVARDGPHTQKLLLVRGTFRLHSLLKGSVSVEIVRVKARRNLVLL